MTRTGPVTVQIKRSPIRSAAPPLLRSGIESGYLALWLPPRSVEENKIKHRLAQWRQTPILQGSAISWHEASRELKELNIGYLDLRRHQQLALSPVPPARPRRQSYSRAVVPAVSSSSRKAVR